LVGRVDVSDVLLRKSLEVSVARVDRHLGDEVATPDRAVAVAVGIPGSRGRFPGQSCYTQSTDGGQTWSTPIKVNATPEEEVPVDNQHSTGTATWAADPPPGTQAFTPYRLVGYGP
jgi:hypothetical protein